MTTTLAELADRAQVTLNDAAAGTWPQATIEEWVVEAIRDYTQTFPRTIKTTITVSGTSPGHEFDLSADYISMLLVEYPGDEDPPVYLKRRSRAHPRFYGYQGYYDVEPTQDMTNVASLFLSVEPSDGEKITWTAKCHHDTTLSSGDDITVPEHHEGLLLLFVLWQAFKERLATEEQDTDTTLAGHVTLLQQLVKGATQAEKEYKAALQRARANVADGGYSGPWQVDDHDRIY
jgi:hypothetical protein